MLFAIGSRVKLVHTGDEGVISQFLEDNMVNVLLDDGDEIPVFADDIINIEDEKRKLSKKPAIKAKVVPGKQEKIPNEPKFPKVAQQYTILKSMGIQLAFEAQLRSDGTTEKYLVHLINDTIYDVLYTFQLSLKNKKGLIKNGQLKSISAVLVDELTFDALNDAPIVDVQCWQVTTEGTGISLQKTLRIKAQHFFKRIKTAPIVEAKVHHYVLFENFKAKEKTEENLKSYTERKARPIKKQSQYYKVNQNDIQAYANFETELDLHLEKISDNPKRLSNSEKVNLQMQAFEAYLSRAIQLGVPRVFIIHGIGKGKLKNRIASVLLQHPDVITFKNEHHPKYGWGATEVIF